ncbi:rCG32404 [Rattus norvegicus]|uniref:RCG32404 n=1 Tax=Rattus norvegicus TaxID=10116 RepID=A6JXS9_RAT|nr:rCG32404 [Rattus norvegicus]
MGYLFFRRSLEPMVAAY